jgi:hypothetical protein
MYSARLGYDEAVHRISKLQRDGHHAEALITSAFTFEKTIRRSLRYFAIARGFTSKHANLLLHNTGFHNMKELWPCFEYQHRTLAESVGNNEWQHVPAAVTMRNKLAHGEMVYNLDECRKYTVHVMAAMNALRVNLKNELGIDAWLPLRRRIKPQLAWIDMGRSK